MKSTPYTIASGIEITLGSPYLHSENASTRAERRGRLKMDLIGTIPVYYRKTQRGHFINNAGHQRTAGYFTSKSYLNKLFPVTEGN